MKNGMKVHSIYRVIYIFIFSIIILASCAKIVAPTGGPKDEDHPLIVEIDPPDYTINFNSEKVNITFNEFIQLKDLNESLVISPPLEENPEIKVKGKTLVIEFLEELKDSTTYNIYFGNSVQDFNEGNPIENYQYVLSTGSYVDSLSISGQVINSFNLLPEEGVFVMLYEELGDSVPIKQIPTYISKTNEEGFFRINNIGHNEYKLFCVRDFNKNYLFDLPNEDIAFTDSLIRFDLINETITDSIYRADIIIVDTLLTETDSLVYRKDTLSKSITITTIETMVNNKLDTIVRDTSYINADTSLILKESLFKLDTIIHESISFYPVIDYTFRLFTEYNELQYLTNNTRETKQKIEITFNKPIKDSLVFSLVDTIIEKQWYIEEINQTRDSIIYWLTDSSFYNQERLIFALNYQREDSNLVYQWNVDTLNMRYVEEKLKRNEEPDTSLKYNVNIQNKGQIDLNKDIKFFFETPLDYYDTSRIDLFEVIDSIEIPKEFEVYKDSIKHRSYSMAVDWSEDTVYRLEVYPGAFTDIYEATNDTSILLFDTQKRDYYGKILVDIIGMDSIPSYQLICQLIIPGKESETVFEEKIIQNNQLVEFDFLPPKEFIFKVILDKNYNGKWDTGEYLKNVQPEEVLYHDEKIKVRSNWDIEVNFNVKKQ